MWFFVDETRHLVQNVSTAAEEHDPTKMVRMVFDQRVKAEKGIALAVKNFIGGMEHINNLIPAPLAGVSHAFAGLQFADVFAFILSKRVRKDRRAMSLYKSLCSLQWESSSKERMRYGFRRFDE